MRKDLKEGIAIATRYNCCIEILLKDVSTVGHDPRRLIRWAEIPRDVTRG